MTDLRSPQGRLGAVGWLFRGVIFLVALSTAHATIFALTQKSTFLEAFPGASESVYIFFLIGGTIGFIALVGLFYFQRWATWIFGVLALFVTIINVGVSAPVRHTLSGVGLTVIILGLGYFCRERFH